MDMSKESAGSATTGEPQRGTKESQYRRSSSDSLALSPTGGCNVASLFTYPFVFSSSQEPGKQPDDKCDVSSNHNVCMARACPDLVHASDLPVEQNMFDTT